MGTVHYILAYLDHFYFRIRQFRDLVHIQQLTGDGIQISMTIRTRLCLQIHNVVRLGHKLALVLDMPLRWSMLAFVSIFRLTGLVA
jgi:hypothetical protein